MRKNEIFVQYLSIFTQVIDEFGGVGKHFPSSKLVRLALLGLLKSYHIYQDSVNQRDKIAYWAILWSKLV